MAKVKCQISVSADGYTGAVVMGRNMFGPVRGPWGDGSWKGWWGDDPPFRVIEAPGVAHIFYRVSAFA